jgi:hypothetical protein
MAARTDTKVSSFTLRERIELVNWKQIGGGSVRVLHVALLVLVALALGWGAFHANQAGYLLDVTVMMLGSIVLWSLGGTAFARLR